MNASDNALLMEIYTIQHGIDTSMKYNGNILKKCGDEIQYDMM